LKELSGANALVTGASRGIGVHIARALAERGVNLALAARSAPELNTLRDSLSGLGITVAAIPTDVSDAAQRHALIERSEAEVGPIDILVNNAGVEGSNAFTAMSEHDIEQVVTVNLTAALLLTRALLPGMLERRRGHVVNIASLAGKMALPFAAPYSATKSALIGATQALRAEYRGTPVGFSVVCPGFVSNEGMYARHEAGGASVPRLAGRTTPEKVARLVVRAITNNRSELITMGSPIRPMLMMQTALPSMHSPLMQYLGITRWGRRAAELEHRGSGDAELQGSSARTTTKV